MWPWVNKSQGMAFEYIGATQLWETSHWLKLQWMVWCYSTAAEHVYLPSQRSKQGKWRNTKWLMADSVPFFSHLPLLEIHFSSHSHPICYYSIFYSWNNNNNNNVVQFRVLSRVKNGDSAKQRCASRLVKLHEEGDGLIDQLTDRRTVRHLRKMKLSVKPFELS